MNYGNNANFDISVTLEELYKGKEHSIAVQRNEICDACHGTGAKDGKIKKCPKCNG